MKMSKTRQRNVRFLAAGVSLVLAVMFLLVGYWKLTLVSVAIAAILIGIPYRRPVAVDAITQEEETSPYVPRTNVLNSVNPSI